VKVKTSELFVEPATAVVGDTVIVPSLLVAAAPTITDGLIAIGLPLPPEPSCVVVVKMALPWDPAVTKLAGNP
jgi:hypothetical protein